MLDVAHLPTQYGNADVQIFTGKSAVSGASWETWMKPRGKSMISILLIGKGGNGGSGVTNAGGAAGGGGGGSGSMTSLTMPLILLPDALFLSLAGQSSSASLLSYISISPATGAGCLIAAGGGGNGANGSSGTGGAGGTAGAAQAASVWPLGYAWGNLNLAGQAGSTGSNSNGSGTFLALPTTGLLCTGGTGGGAMANTVSTAGGNGGAITGAGSLYGAAGGAAAPNATTPPGNGVSGCNLFSNGFFSRGGTGGGGIYNVPTGAGLVQSTGGHGYYGSGGGGGGGAYTGNTAGGGGQGGPAIAFITCW